MISLKKATSTPQFARFALEGGQLPAKPNKQYLQVLESQVNKSRIALENMSQVKALDPNFYKKIEQLQKELHRCILAINQETNKNKTLSEVITLLKGEMNEVQAVQRNEEEYESNNFEKKIKKVEYDIKQILHKYNEEIAKINSLKEEANASRDERVVYSNLFNKIEKEIKHYEEIYKQTLIKNEMFLDQKKENQNSKPIESRDDILEETGQFFERVAEQAKSINTNQYGTSNELTKIRQTKSRQAKKSLKINEGDMFITNIRETKPQVESNKASFENTTRKDKNSSLNENIENLIREREGDIERVLMSCQCKNLEDAIDYYTEIDGINDGLYSEIDRLESKIVAAEGEIDRLKRQKRTSEVYENGQISEMINISKNCRSNKNLVWDLEETSEDECTTILQGVCAILNVEQSEDEKSLNDDVLREIDRQIDGFGCAFYERKTCRKESKMVTAEQGNQQATDRAVSELLDKIDRFNESDKIFDRTMLRMQYQKQLSKARKKAKRSN